MIQKISLLELASLAPALWVKRIQSPTAPLLLCLARACALVLEIVCDLGPERASQRATDLGFSRYGDNWRDVVEDDKVELVSICTPNDTHAEIAIAALKGGQTCLV